MVATPETAVSMTSAVGSAERAEPTFVMNVWFSVALLVIVDSVPVVAAN